MNSIICIHEMAHVQLCLHKQFDSFLYVHKLYVYMEAW